MRGPTGEGQERAGGAIQDLGNGGQTQPSGRCCARAGVGTRDSPYRPPHFADHGKRSREVGVIEREECSEGGKLCESGRLDIFVFLIPGRCRRPAFFISLAHSSDAEASYTKTTRSERVEQRAMEGRLGVFNFRLRDHLIFLWQHTLYYCFTHSFPPHSIPDFINNLYCVPPLHSHVMETYPQSTFVRMLHRNEPQTA